MRTYKDICQIMDFEERLKYAYIGGGIGDLTFGSHRWDNGNDLACEGRPIFRGILIHHLEPVTIEDIFNRADKVFDPDNLICVSHETHNFIHYGIVENRIPHKDRTPNDQCPWKQ